MWQDPIVAETRILRDEYARQFNYDAEAIFEDLMTRQAMHPERVVSLPARKVDRALVISPTALLDGRPLVRTADPTGAQS